MNQMKTNKIQTINDLYREMLRSDSRKFQELSLFLRQQNLRYGKKTDVVAWIKELTNRWQNIDAVLGNH